MTSKSKAKIRVGVEERRNQKQGRLLASIRTEGRDCSSGMLAICL